MLSLLLSQSDEAVAEVGVFGEQGLLEPDFSHFGQSLFESNGIDKILPWRVVVPDFKPLELNVPRRVEEMNEFPGCLT